MLLTYLKISLRNFFKNKLHSIINLSGLSIGLVCCLLISLYVQKEMSYDRFNINADRIVLLTQFEKGPGSGGRLATDMKQRFAQVEQTVRLKKTTPLLKARQAAAYEQHFYFADSSVFSVFSFPLLSGNAATALKEQYGVVISEAMAQKYFPGINPLGQELRYNNTFRLHITGVMKNLPATAHLPIDFIANYANANELAGYDVMENYWGGDSWTYLLLAPNTKPASIEAQFPAYLKQLNDPNAAGVWKLKLVPLTDVYLRTSLVADHPITYVYIFSMIGIFILALACFNYINLATARSGARAKEIGVRKVMGSSNHQLRLQFILETTGFILLAFVTAVLLLQLSLPAFNRLADTHLTLAPLWNTKGLLYLLSGIAILSLLAGLYPAFVLAAFNPATVLKGTIVPASGKSSLQRILVVLQFSVSMVMIAATLIVYRQLYFIQHKDLGYQREQVLTLDLRDAPAGTKQVFTEGVKKIAEVTAATRAYSLPGSGSLQGMKLVSEYVPVGAADAGINRLTMDDHFLETFGIQLKEGRMLNAAVPGDKQKFMINEAAKQYFNWKNINGKMTGYYSFQYNADGSYREIPVRGEVVGVVADYNHADLRTAVQPMIISLNEGWESQVAIRLKAGTLKAGIEHVKDAWKQYFPDKPFEYNFLDTAFEQTYRAELKTGRVFGLFALLAIIISCLGLTGLIAHIANARRKEISIRKVLGASVGSLVNLMAKEFVVLVAIGWIIAVPLAWWGMHQWLQYFAYRISISAWIFFVAGLLAVLIACITVSVQAIKAALANPVRSLRS
jgi:putative ABC transport system permease protein